MSTPLTGRMIAAARTPANDHAAARLAALGRAASHRDLPAPSEPVQRHRGGHGFVRESNHCRPLNRNDRARLMQLAESLERRTKPSGKRNGSLGYTGIRVLKALMALFANARSGLCCPRRRSGWRPAVCRLPSLSCYPFASAQAAWSRVAK
jgi:hypothetical protein